MNIYNSLTNKIEPITPIHDDHIGVYTCGPTVYDYPHIGNWFTFIRYDLLVRTLKVSGMYPKWVMNITDVGHLVSDADEGEDKLEKGAKREGKTAWEVAKLYGDYFLDGLKRLNIIEPDYLPKATEHIKEQIELIKELESKGFTYIIDDGVYYDTSKFPKYASFARLDLNEQQAGARVKVNKQKRSNTDFALWKFSPKDHKRDMEWDSPWGRGFPGLHIECSAMSMKYLGETIDIHSGGIDHIPVHHSNEIAQSEAVTEKIFANYWMHTNHILIEGEKIAKSSGNGLTLEDIEKHGYSLQAFRLLVLQSHYRSQSKFSWEDLEAAQNRLKDYQTMADLRWQLVGEKHGIDDINFGEFETSILTNLQNDLDTPKALSELSHCTKIINKRLVYEAEKTDFENFLKKIDLLLGTELSNRLDITDEQKQIIISRNKARENKDWQKSDQLREELEKQGIGLNDNESNQTWYRL